MVDDNPHRPGAEPNSEPEPGSESTSGDPDANLSILGRIFNRKLPLETETTRFILANALDVFMTYLALSYSAAGRTSRLIGEGNPIARWFINRWGPKGMVFLKFTVVAFVVVLAQIIAQRKMSSARRLLNFGTILVTCVVIYSFILLLRAL